MPGGVISHPYDPLLVMLLAFDCGDTAVPPLFDVEELGHTLGRPEGEGAAVRMHLAVGINESRCGIKNPIEIKDALIRLISAGLEICNYPPI